MTRASARPDAGLSTAHKPSKTASLTEAGSGRSAGFADYDAAALLERVAAREKAREPVLQLIAAQADARGQAARTWTLDRAWPRERLREAWVCARHGARLVAEHSASAAGWLRDEDYARLRRAAARYERHAAARPVGYPATGLAALLHIGELAAAGDGGPRLLGYAIGALDQLSRRMRAVRTDLEPARVQRASRLAQQRRAPGAPTSPIAFRIPGARWPRWLQLDAHGQPLIVNGELLLHGGWAPAANSDEYRIVLRDAYLLSRGHLARHVDGRAEMAINTERLTAGRTGRAAAGPYPDGPDRRDRVDRDVLELARRSNISLADAQRISPDVRSDVLAQLRRRDAETVRHQAAALRRRLADLNDADASTT